MRGTAGKRKVAGSTPAWGTRRKSSVSPSSDVRARRRGAAPLLRKIAWRLVASAKLSKVEVGARTLVTHESVDAYIAQGGDA